jgi:malonyl-CoA O-methyltransferase
LQFNQAINYDEYAFAQKIIAQSFFEWLLTNKFISVNDNQEDINIYELGCGSGFLSEVIYNYFTKNINKQSIRLNLNLVDVSENMLKMCKTKLENLEHNQINLSYVNANAEYLKINENINNIILSNMCMQWFDDINIYIKNNIANSKLIAFTVPTTNSFANWQSIHDELGIKCALHQLISPQIIKEYAYIKHVEFMHIPIEFSSIKEFMQHFKLIGAYNKNSENIHYSIADLRKLINYKHGSFTSSYEIAIVICGII